MRALRRIERAQKERRVRDVAALRKEDESPSVRKKHWRAMPRLVTRVIQFCDRGRPAARFRHLMQASVRPSKNDDALGAPRAPSRTRIGQLVSGPAGYGNSL